MKNFKIAITGCNGYIGSYLQAFLMRQGHIIYAMSRQPNTADQQQAIHFELGKPNNYTALADIDILIHCAYDFSVTDYVKARQINVEGSLDLFKHAKEQGVRRIINLSSTSAFADAVANYGRIKYEIEQKAKAYGVTTIRPGLVFNKHARGIVGALYKLIAKLPVAPIIGKGDQVFFPCHLKDLALLINVLLTTELDTTDSPIIAASEQTITFKQLILTLAELHHKRILLFSLPYHLLYSSLKLAEWLPLKLGLRSDSLKYLKYYNRHLDFTLTRRIGIPFRPFTVATYQADV